MRSSAPAIGGQINHLKDKKTSLQPSGDNIADVKDKDIILYFDGVKYLFKSVIRAFEILFKIIYVFNLEFPPESSLFYSFCESYFYKFITKN